MVTLIADNYFGYCKKEVKTQISYSANLFGLAEEEQAGDRFTPDQVRIVTAGHRFSEVIALLGDRARRPSAGIKAPTLEPRMKKLGIVRPR